MKQYESLLSFFLANGENVTPNQLSVKWTRVTRDRKLDGSPFSKTEGQRCIYWYINIKTGHLRSGPTLTDSVESSLVKKEILKRVKK